VFGSSPRGTFNLYQKAISGTGRNGLLVANGNSKHPTQWSRDGKFISYSENDPKTRRDIWVLPMVGVERKPVPFLRSETNEIQGQLSPDSHWMAYTSDETGQTSADVSAATPFFASSSAPLKRSVCAVVSQRRAPTEDLDRRR
jgi:Tol biopolymer transport system component